jgi:RHS repeat-associated protein
MIHRGTDPANPGWTRTYSYAEPSLLEPSQVSDRLTSTSDGADVTSPSFTYDAHGNTTFMPELPLMRWDYHDQLQATSRQTVKNGGSPETTYFLYDATGQRVRKVTERQAQPGKTASRKSERIYFGGFEVFRRYGARGATALERETLHIMGGEQRIALVETRTAGKDHGPEQLPRYQLTTHLGSTTLELDALARIISYEEYYPYGCTSYQAVARQTDTSKRYRYTGMERDEESGFSYHSARYYSPWLGRWISPDPKGIGDGTNLYGYVSENPIALTDGSGLQEERQTWLAEVIQFVINPKATRRGSGVSKLQRLALKGIDIAFGPGTGPRGRGSGLDWGHPKAQPHGITLATQDPPLRPEPYGPNRSSYPDKLTKQRAAAAGQPVRNAKAVDPTAKIGARQTQPTPKPFEQPMADYWESSKQWTPPTQTPRAAPTASPASGPSNQLDLPFDRPAPPGGGTGPPSKDFQWRGLLTW